MNNKEIEKFFTVTEQFLKKLSDEGVRAFCRSVKSIGTEKFASKILEKIYDEAENRWLASFPIKVGDEVKIVNSDCGILNGTIGTVLEIRECLIAPVFRVGIKCKACVEAKGVKQDTETIVFVDVSLYQIEKI